MPLSAWVRRFARFRVFLVVALLVIAYALLNPFVISTSKQPTGPVNNQSLENASVTLETGPCNGTCPIYEIQVCSDGIVHYRGYAHTETLGYEGYEIPEERAHGLIEEADRIDFFSMGKLEPLGGDVYLTTVTVSVGPHSKSVREPTHERPNKLQPLQEELRAIAGDRISHVDQFDHEVREISNESYC